MSPFQCPSCDRSFETDHGLKVHHSKTHGQNLPNRECKACDTEFYSEYERKYCSEGCRLEAVSFAGANNPNYGGGKAITICDICGQEFEYYPSDKQGRYCPTCVESEQWRSPPSASGSDHPQWNGGKRTVSCNACGDEIERWPNRINGRTFCDVDCQGEWLSEHFVGTDHPNWQENEKIAYGPGWEDAREEALERDGYSCQVCGQDRHTLGQNPDVHHITPVRWFVKSDNHSRIDAHSLHNLLSLCRSCHREAETGDISESKLRSLISS